MRTTLGFYKRGNTPTHFSKVNALLKLYSDRNSSRLYVFWFLVEPSWTRIRIRLCNFSSQDEVGPTVTGYFLLQVTDCAVTRGRRKYEDSSFIFSFSHQRQFALILLCTTFFLSVSNWGAKKVDLPKSGFKTVYEPLKYFLFVVSIEH